MKETFELHVNMLCGEYSEEIKELCKKCRPDMVLTYAQLEEISKEIRGHATGVIKRGLLDEGKSQLEQIQINAGPDDAPCFKAPLSVAVSIKYRPSRNIEYSILAAGEPEDVRKMFFGRDDGTAYWVIMNSSEIDLGLAEV